ncbi:hypothetical protein ANCCAN_20633 [Ancylostoma caninum]|uniref:Uncharacterized protein n=1 Tax=Ancylostoma caninum TaxID=29170 RepID=A0A368FRS5_ANCCA|nr:hypothetical protein ANCCAN_20633 [Ancylostoma caninum]
MLCKDGHEWSKPSGSSRSASRAFSLVFSLPRGWHHFPSGSYRGDTARRRI